MNSDKIKARKKADKKHIIDVIEKIPYFEDSLSVSDPLEGFGENEKLIEIYGPYYQIGDGEDTQILIKIIESGAFSLLNGDLNIYDQHILKALSQNKINAKVKRISVSGFKTEKIEDDLFTILAKCKITFEEIEISFGESSLIAFGNFLEVRRYLVSEIKKINFSISDFPKEKANEIIAKIVKYSEYFKKLENLKIYASYSATIPFEILFKNIDKLNMELELNNFDKENFNVFQTNFDFQLNNEQSLKINLYVDSDWNLNDEKLYEFFDEIPLKFVKALRFNSSNLKGEFFDQLAHNTNLELTQFEFSGSSETSKDSLDFFIKSDRCKKLELLEIRDYFFQFPPKALVEIFTSCSNLKSLGFSGVNVLKTPEWLTLLKHKFESKITTLSLYGSSNITIEVIKEMCQNECFSDLTYLDIDSLSLNNEAFDYLPQIKKLKTLDLSRNSFTDFTKLIQSDLFKSLENLYMHNYKMEITNHVLKEISKLQYEIKMMYIGAQFDSESLSLIIESQCLKNFKFSSIAYSSLEEKHLVSLIKIPEKMKKMWKITVKKEDIQSQTIRDFLNSPNLNPFFRKQFFFNQIKEEITNEVLNGMKDNKYFMQFLLELDLSKCNQINGPEGIIGILSSQYISPYFDVSGLLQSVKDLQKIGKKEDILKCLKKFKLLKKLDLSGYSLKAVENKKHIFDFFNKATFPNLRELNLSKTDLDDGLLEKLFPPDDNEEKSVINNLVLLALSYNKKITSAGFTSVFRKFREGNRLMGLELDGCSIENENLAFISSNECKFKKNLEYLSIAKCSLINSRGLEEIMTLQTETKKFKMMNIYRDYKGLLKIDKDQKKIYLCKPERSHIYKIQKIFVNKFYQNLKHEEQKLFEDHRYAVTDSALKDFVENEHRIQKFHTLDFTKCPISSEGLKYIADCNNLRNLTTLILNKTPIDDEGIDYLCNKMVNLKTLEIDGCEGLTKNSLKSILAAKSFDNEFNPEKILEKYAPMIDLSLIEDIEKSKYLKNIKVISLKNNGNLNIECLIKLLDLEIQMEKNNLKLELGLLKILQKFKDQIDDDLIIKLSKSKLINTVERISMNSKPNPNKADAKFITQKGLEALILSPNIRKDFKLEPLISELNNLIDDSILEAISKSKCFQYFQYTPALKQCNENQKKEIEEEAKKAKENELKPEEQNKNKEIEKKPIEAKQRITSDGLWHLSRSPNTNFRIQQLIFDFGEMITSSFIKNMVQQLYFKKIEDLNLKNCSQLKDDDLCLIIKGSHENFHMEDFIKATHLPNGNMSLVTNNVLKAISKSAYMRKRYWKESKKNQFDEHDFDRFNFAMNDYPKVDYAINYLIQAYASQVRHYALYLENFTSYLSFESLKVMRNDIANYINFDREMKKQKEGKKELELDFSTAYKDNEGIVEKLARIKNLKFSQNKYIFDPNIELSLKDAFDNFQNQNDLNLDRKTIKYYVTQISNKQAQNNTAESFDRKHETLLFLIKHCPNLEEINLDNLNLGDDFLKRFSIYISENKTNLINLKVFEIKNNYRITAVGLKYLFCSIIQRTDVLETITVKDESTDIRNNNDIATFVSSGLKGMIDKKLTNTSLKLREIYTECLFKIQQADATQEGNEMFEEEKDKDNDEEKREEIKEDESESDHFRQLNNNQKEPPKCWIRFKAFINFLLVPQTLKILGIIFLTSPFLAFHFFEKLIFKIPPTINSCFSWMSKLSIFKVILYPFKKCWKMFEKLYDCFGNCFKVGSYRKKTSNSKAESPLNKNDNNEKKGTGTENEREKLKEEEKKDEENPKENDQILEKKEEEIIFDKKNDPFLQKDNIFKNKKNEKKKKEVDISLRPVSPTKSKKSGDLNPNKKFSFISCCFPCLKKNYSGTNQLLKEELQDRYRECKEAIKQDIDMNNPRKPLFSINNSANANKEPEPKDNSDKNDKSEKDKNKEKTKNYSAYFYYDESLINLNDILYGKISETKSKNKTYPFDAKTNEEQKNLLLSQLSPKTPTTIYNAYSDSAQNQENKKENSLPFFLVSKMKWIILFDFIAFYILVLFYLLYMKLVLHENATLFNQIPYFVYGFVSFLLEISLCWEVISIINNEELVSISDATVISNLITSQTAKYDTFTNVTFVLTNLTYNEKTDSFEHNAFFIASLIFVGMNILLNFKNYFGFLHKNFFAKKKRPDNQYHSSENINKYSKLCFQFDFQSLGRLLDRFSTNSAKKYGYFFLPKSLYNVYIPTVITATFARLFLEDLPLLVIQLNVIIADDTYNFTNIASLASTILAMFTTLHTAWNVKPSIFNRTLFEQYFGKTKEVKKKRNNKFSNDNQNKNKNDNQNDDKEDPDMAQVEAELEKEENKLAIENFDDKILVIQKEHKVENTTDKKTNNKK